MLFSRSYKKLKFRAILSPSSRNHRLRIPLRPSTFHPTVNSNYHNNNNDKNSNNNSNNSRKNT